MKQRYNDGSRDRFTVSPSDELLYFWVMLVMMMMMMMIMAEYHRDVMPCNANVNIYFNLRIMDNLISDTNGPFLGTSSPFWTRKQSDNSYGSAHGQN